MRVEGKQMWYFANHASGRTMSYIWELLNCFHACPTAGDF